MAEDFEDLHTVPGITIGEMLDVYLVSREAVLSPSTIRGYRSTVRTLKTQYTAFCALTEASPSNAQMLISDMLRDGLKPKTIKNMIGLLSSSVKFSGGRFPDVALPRWELRSNFVPSEEDMRLIVKEVSGTKMEIPVALGMMGLRRSEIAGLSVDDLEGNVLHIHRALVYGSDNQTHEKGTKTVSSHRTIAIPEALADQIRKKGLPKMSPGAITCAFIKIANRLGLSIRFHDLRHFFASYAHTVLGLSFAQVMALGGWKTDTALKRFYLHSMRDREAAETVATGIGDLFGGTHGGTP